jgi:hypothetical protein
MNAEQALFDAYREWRRLAWAIRKAISKRDWGFLLECQNIIRQIQPSITNLRQQALEEWRRKKLDGAAKEKELLAVVLELKDLLESNKKLLHTARITALARRQKLELAERNLKRLRASYTSARPPAWTSFS